MTRRRAITTALSLTLLASIALPAVAAATSIAPPLLEPVYDAKEPLWHQGSKVGAAMATVTGGNVRLALTKVSAQLEAPRPNLTWKARVIATISCATPADPETGTPASVTRSHITTPWTTTTMHGSMGTLPVKGFSFKCAGTATIAEPTTVRVQVSRPSGLAYALSTIYTAG